MIKNNKSLLIIGLVILLLTGCSKADETGLKTGKTYYFQLATLYTENMDQVGIYNCVEEGLDESYIKVDMDSKKVEYCLAQNGKTWFSHIGDITDIEIEDSTTTCTINFPEMDGYYLYVYSDGELQTFLAQNGDLGVATFSISENTMFENSKKSDHPKIEVADIDGRITIKYPKLENVTNNTIYNSVVDNANQVFASFNPTVSYIDDSNTVLIELDGSADLRTAIASNKAAAMSSWEGICEQFDSICEKYYVAFKTVGYNSIRVNINFVNASDRTDILYSTVNGKEKIDFTDSIIEFKPQDQTASNPTTIPHDAPSSSGNSFTNKYGTKTTKCHHSDCNNYIASSGDTWDCSYHANKCLNCGKYIDCDAMYCMDCLEGH